MSFAFGFAGDDIESDGDAEELTNSIASINIEHSTPSIPPQSHSLRELLSSLPSQLSYNYLAVPKHSNSNDDQTNGNGSASSAVVVPRRSVFDMRTQLMAEANPEENDNDNLLAGLERGDLSSGIYEGGFKTWECSIDLASLLTSVDVTQHLHVIELGAGSAIPSLVLLQRALSLHRRTGQVHFTLCDYNEDVLRLATAPNVFLVQQALDGCGSRTSEDDEEELEDIDMDSVAQAEKAFDTGSISFDFISGGWGDEFVRLLDGPTSSSSTRPDEVSTLILASETIYSPASTRTFSEILMKLLRSRPNTSKAWVAAKKIYFGVGGGVEDFQAEVLKRGGNVRTILDVKDAGVARVVLEVTA